MVCGVDSSADYQCCFCCKLHILTAARLLSAILLSTAFFLCVLLIGIVIGLHKLEDTIRTFGMAYIIILASSVLIIPTLNVIGAFTANRYWFLPYICITLISLPLAVLSIFFNPAQLVGVLLQCWFLHIYWRCYSYLADVENASFALPMHQQQIIIMVPDDQQRQPVLHQSVVHAGPPPAYSTLQGTSGDADFEKGKM